MSHPDFDKQKLIDFWIAASDDDFDTMLVMFEGKRYNWALFIGHLSIEKLLKALFVKVNNDHPPLSHNLLRLAEMCRLTPNEDQIVFFVTVTAFNINARYDDYKMSFRERCTPGYTTIWIEKIRKEREWIRARIQK